MRTISGTAGQSKLLCIRNGKGLRGLISLAKKWVDKVINISRVGDRMIVNKVLIQRIIISLTSDLTVYIPQSGLDDGQKDDFCGSLIMSLEC